MPPKASKPKILDIPWRDDNDQLVWAFIMECERDVNYKVLFEKRVTMEVCQIFGCSESHDNCQKKQNTSGDLKITVFRQIAQVILLELFAIDGTTVANWLKGQLERYVLVLYFNFSICSNIVQLHILFTNLKKTHKNLLEACCLSLTNRWQT